MRSTLANISSLLLGLAFLIVGHGLQMTLIPLRAEAEGWTSFEIGVIGSAFYVGFVAGCIGAPYLIRRAAHIRAFTAMVSVATAAMVALPLWVAFGPWFVLRVLFGASIAGLYMVIESWLNDGATNATRGGIMAAYVMVNYASIAVGQLIVTLHTPNDFTLFAVGAIAVTLAAIPVALTGSAQPAPIAIVRFNPRELFRLSPVGVVGVTVVGLANGAFWSLGAVAAVGAGLSVQGAAIFLAIVTAAGALAQWPAGRLSDRIDRRYVLIGLLAGAAVVGLLFVALPAPQTTWLFLAVVFGCLMAPTYSITAAHAYDHAAPGTFVETAAGLFIANASGAIVGPLVASAMMGLIGPSALFLFTAAAQGALAVYVYIRVRSRPAPVAPEKADFDLAAAVPVPGGVPLEVGDPAVILPDPPPGATQDAPDGPPDVPTDADPDVLDEPDAAR
jgi:MFS family permease